MACMRRKCCRAVCSSGLRTLNPSSAGILANFGHPLMRKLSSSHGRLSTKRWRHHIPATTQPSCSAGNGIEVGDAQIEPARVRETARGIAEAAHAMVEGLELV